MTFIISDTNSTGMSEDCLSIVEKYSSKKILVVGDFMIDRYYYGDVTRIASEAPILIFLSKQKVDVCGGAGNTAANILALRGQVYVAGIVGRDADGKILHDFFNNNYCLIEDDRCTTTKTRFKSNDHQGHYVGHRHDQEDTAQISGATQKTLIERLNETIPEVDAVVVSDYDKGVFTPSVAQAIHSRCKELNKAVIVDVKPKHKHLAYKFDVVKPNWKEIMEMLGKHNPETFDVGLAKGLVGELSNSFESNIVLTLGKNGLIVSDRSKIEYIPAQERRAVDVTGCGDTVSANLALALASGADIFQAAYIANMAGGLKV